MEEKLYKISAYLKKEELRQFMTWVRARGVSQSGFIREQLTFDVRPRGAPKGPRKKAKQAKVRKPVKTVVKKKEGASQLSLLD